jgi:hypothetical protein
LELVFAPGLKGELFTCNKMQATYYRDGQPTQLDLPAGTYAFNFLGRTLVVYHNPKKRNTFGPKAAKVVRCELAYRSSKKNVLVAGPAIPAPYAGHVREGRIERIDVYLE